MRPLAVMASLLAVLAFPAYAQVSTPDLDNPIELFKTVCLSDEVKLPKESLNPRSFDALPIGARRALGFANPATAVPKITPPFDLTTTDVPNGIFAIMPKKRSYLLTPVETAGRYATSCAVVWKGNHYDAAVEMAKGLAIDTPLPNTPELLSPIRGLNYAVFNAKGMIVGAAEYRGWTVLRIAPNSSLPQEPNSQ